VFEQGEDCTSLLAVHGTGDGLKRVLDGGAAVVVRWDETFDELAEGRARKACRFQDSGGDSLESILPEFESFAAVCGSAPLPGGAHGQSLGGRWSHDHNVDGPSPVFTVRENYVCSLVVVVVRWDLLLAVYGGVPPVMNYFVKGVGYGIVPFNGACAECAAKGMMAFSVAVARTPISVGAVERAGAGFEDVVAEPHTDR
jgi:hypothetical protein